MENEATGGVKGKFTMGGCGVIGGECSVMGMHDCEEQFDRYGTKADGSENPIGKVSYWIFQAVKGMQNKFTILRNRLVDETIVTNLLIGEMVEAFQGNEEKTEEVFKWLSAAIGLGSTVGGLIPGAVSFSPVLCPETVSRTNADFNRERVSLQVSTSWAVFSISSPRRQNPKKSTRPPSPLL